MTSGNLGEVAGALLAPEPAQTAPVAHRPPGAVIVVVQGATAHDGCAGIADLDSGATMTLAHAHDLASVSKVLTTLCLVALVDAGHLSVQATVAQLLGAGRAGAYGAATVSDLARHQAGLPEWYPLYLLPGASADPVRAALGLEPRYGLREGYHYSDLGFMILGAVVEAVTGRPFAHAVREVVLDPIGADTVTPGRPPAGVEAATGPHGDAIEREMVATGVPYPLPPVPPIDAHWQGWRDHTLRGEISDGNAFHAFGGGAGHAGWFADPDGLVRLAQRIVAADRLWELSARQGFDKRQGFGVRRYRASWGGVDREFLGHPGFAGSMIAASRATAAAPMPVAVVLATNRLHGRPAPAREALANVEDMSRAALALADARLHDGGEL